MYRFFIISLTISLLSACGVKGDLYLPGQNPPAHKKNKDKTDDPNNPDSISNAGKNDKTNPTKPITLENLIFNDK